MPEFYLVPKRLARRAPLLAKLTHRLEAVVFRSLFWAIRRLSLENALRLSGAVFALLGRTSGKADKARTNLAIAFRDESPEWREKTIRGIFRHLGYSAVELIKLDQIWEQREQRIEYVMSPEARAHLESRAPTMFITAHIGPWQVAPLVTREFGIHINTIYAPESNPVMNELMQELRASISDHLISSEEGPRPLLKELKAGHSIVLALDTRPDTGKLIPFFGRDALTNTSAVGLALRAGASLVIGHAQRLPGARYRIIVHEPLVSPLPDADIKDQASALTEMIYAHFEEWIRESPDQWICLKRRWPKANKL